MKNRGYDMTRLGVTLEWDSDPVSHGSTWDAGGVHVDPLPPAQRTASVCLVPTHCLFTP